MTVATLNELLDTGDERIARTKETGQQIQAALRAGITWVGWLAAKLVLLTLWCVAAPFYGAGYATSRWIIPAGKWTAAAFAVGYEQGRKRRP